MIVWILWTKILSFFESPRKKQSHFVDKILFFTVDQIIKGSDLKRKWSFRLTLERMRLVLNNSLHFEWLEEIARRLSLGAVSTDFLRRKKVVVQNMPSGVYSQVSPKVFRLGRKSFGRWRWEVLLNEDEMEKVKRRWFWNGLKKSAWPILEFVTLRSKFVTLIFRTLGGENI